MSKLPSLLPLNPNKPDQADSVVLAVYAPFGGDPVLSNYPGTSATPIHRQALVRALQQVARQGVHVCALIDLFDDDTFVVDIPAGQPKHMTITSAWKEDMSSPRALSGFLRLVHYRHPCAAVVLALEGHGAAFLPDIDTTRITAQSISGGGQYVWQLGAESTTVAPAPGSPALPVPSPELPVPSPELPAVRLPISTWGLGWALAHSIKCGANRPAVIHFNNCFNMSVELLHTVAPYADFATGYGNYNFFTAGAAYPKVFARLRQAGQATREQLAQWFAAENAAGLRAKGNHPTIGATVRLSHMKSVAGALDGLSLALVSALRPADAADRPAALALIKSSIEAAQQYDSEGDQVLNVPDQLTDLGSLAAQLSGRFPAGPVRSAAAAMSSSLKDVWQYGDFDRPWTNEAQVWDFRDRRLGMNILLPDPALQGLWDWRSPYYLSGKVDPNKPPAQRHVIGFLADRPQRPPWVEFIVEYHRDVPFAGLRRARAPVFPIFDRSFEPKYPPPRDDGNPQGNSF